MDDKPDDDSANHKKQPLALTQVRGLLPGDPGQIRTADPALRRRVP